MTAITSKPDHFTPIVIPESGMPTGPMRTFMDDLEVVLLPLSEQQGLVFTQTDKDSITSNTNAVTWTTTGSIDLTSGSPTAVSLFSGATDVEEIVIGVEGFSTNTPDQAAMIQLGDSGGLENTGYSGQGTDVAPAGEGSSANSSGFLMSREAVQDPADISDFSIRLDHMGSNVWMFSSSGYLQGSPNRHIFGFGFKTLTGALDRVTLTTSGGAATFDGGTAYARYR